MNKITYIIGAMVLMSGALLAASGVVETNYSSVFNSWLSVAFLAIMASFMLVGIYYALGTIIGNSTIKQTAINELGQVVGTGIIIAVVLALMPFLGTLLMQVVPKGTLTSICNGPLSTTALYMTSSSNSPATKSICNIISGNTDTITERIDYGLAGAYVIIANLTSQAAQNLDGIYQFGAYVNFLTFFAYNESICQSQEPAPFVGFSICAIPIIPRSWTLGIEFRPLAGYSFINLVTGGIITQALWMFYLLLVQLFLVIVMMYIWPYMLAAGIILRATIFGKRVGGMLIALAIVSISVFPLVYMLAFNSLSSATLSPIGATSPLPKLLMNTKDFSGKVGVYPGDNINFFVFPQAAYIANYYGCYPLVDGRPQLINAELNIVSRSLVPIPSLVAAVTSVFTNPFGVLPTIRDLTSSVGTSCSPDNVIHALFDLINMYGIMSVSAVMLPVLILVITLGGVKGVSALIGGDTNILGIGKYL